MGKTTQPPAAPPAEKKVKPEAEASGAADGEKKVSRRKYRARPGRAALRAIQKYQKTTETLVQRAPVRRLVREVLNEVNPEMRITKTAMTLLHHAMEAAGVNALNVANALACDLNKGKTVDEKHLRVARNILFHPHKLADSGIVHGSLLG